MRLYGVIRRHTDGDGLCRATPAELGKEVRSLHLDLDQSLDRLEKHRLVRRKAEGYQPLLPKDLRGADLSKLDLRGEHLLEADLSNANLRGANLQGVNLRKADLSWANLAGADLRETHWRKARAVHADFTGADLRGADLTEGYFTRAKFHHCQVKNCRVGRLLNPVEEFQGATFKGTNVLDFRGIANNHTIFGWWILRQWEGAANRMFSARIIPVDSKLGCWQLAFADMMAHEPEASLRTFHELARRYATGELDAEAFVALSLELKVMEYRLAGRDADELFHRLLAAEGLSRPVRIFLRFNLRSVMSQGLEALGIPLPDLEEQVGPVKESNFRRNVYRSLHREGKPDLTAAEMRNLEGAMARLPIPTEEQLIEQLQRIP